MKFCVSKVEKNIIQAEYQYKTCIKNTSGSYLINRYDLNKKTVIEYKSLFLSKHDNIIELCLNVSNV